MMTERQLEDKIEELESQIKAYKDILNSEARIKFGRPKNSFQYSEEKISFLQENKEMNMVDLIIKYNEKFSTDLPRTSRAIYNFMIRAGIIERNYKNKYSLRSPETVEKALKTKEEKFLKEVGIDEDTKD